MTKDEAIKELRSFLGQLTEGCQEAIKVLIPELKESEGEIHRKWILEYLYEGLRETDEQFKEQFKSAIDWLERQKDAFENGRQLGIMQEQARQELELTDEKQKEQKTTEDWREKRKKECPFRRNLDNNLYGCERYAGLISGCNGICSWVVDYPKLKEIQDKKKQKPMKTKPEIKFADNYSKMVWEKLMSKFRAIEGYQIGANDVSNIVLNAILNAFKWQKEQKPKWSKEDEDNLHRVIRVLEDNDSDWEELSNWLKSLRPQPHWKPSEEQMKALEYASHGWKELEINVLPNKALQSLYEDLKKL